MSAKKALISVSDKKGIIEFAKNLETLGYEIISTGGTFKELESAGIKATQVSEYTGFPEMMGGRVKTLHPKVHGAILGDRDNEAHVKAADDNGVEWIDIVVVNLYPFVKVAADEDSTQDQIIENIDIGGPSMIRSAAKNHRHVAIVTDPNDYESIIEELNDYNMISIETKQRLACKAFEKTKLYDQAINGFFRKVCDLPEFLDLHYEKVRSLRYGENPHQKAAFFKNPENNDANITNAIQLGGKVLSFNNIVDANSAIELVKEFEEPAVIFIKHNNPCGVATSSKIEKAFELSHKVDPLSAFGSVIAVNRTVNDSIVDYIEKHKLFIEIICAPKFEESALKRLQERQNLRILELDELQRDTARRDIKKVAGGILIQSADTALVKKDELKTVTKSKPTNNEVEAMLFASKVVKHVKSNAVIYAKVDSHGNKIVTGIGAGQMSRVDAVFIGRKKGGDQIPGSVMASDAFFPFADGVEEAESAGVTAIIQPGGSIRDEEVIKRADELGISMVFTGLRSFRH